MGSHWQPSSEECEVLSMLSRTLPRPHIHATYSADAPVLPLYIPRSSRAAGTSGSFCLSPAARGQPEIDPWYVILITTPVFYLQTFVKLLL